MCEAEDIFLTMGRGPLRVERFDPEARATAALNTQRGTDTRVNADATHLRARQGAPPFSTGGIGSTGGR